MTIGARLATRSKAVLQVASRTTDRLMHSDAYTPPPSRTAEESRRRRLLVRLGQAPGRFPMSRPGGRLVDGGRTAVDAAQQVGVIRTTASRRQSFGQVLLVADSAGLLGPACSGWRRQLAPRPAQPSTGAESVPLGRARPSGRFGQPQLPYLRLRWAVDDPAAGGGTPGTLCL